MKIVPNPAYQALTISRLSAREFEIFCDIACGVTPQQTADKYGLSVKTVSTYRARVLAKLQLQSSAEIAVMAFQAGVTRVEDEIQENGQEKIPKQEELFASSFERSSPGGGDTEGFSPTIGNHAGETT